MAGRPHGRFPGLSLLSLRPKSGRTHQLRVHLADEGHPVVGDPVYGPRRRAADDRPAGALGSFSRQALHAARLGFAHPRTGAAMEFRAPAPPDMERLLGELRRGATGADEKGVDK